VEAEEARTKTAPARDREAPGEEQAELRRKAEAAADKAKAARDAALAAAENVGVEPPDLEPLAADSIPRRGLARRADGAPTTKTQRNFTDPDSHLMQSGGAYVQGYNRQPGRDPRVAGDLGHALAARRAHPYADGVPHGSVIVRCHGRRFGPLVDGSGRVDFFPDSGGPASCSGTTFDSTPPPRSWKRSGSASPLARAMCWW
jgi:hypothetical protein